MVGRSMRPNDFAYKYKEVDLEFEELTEIEAENMVKDEESFENLHGGIISISKNFVSM